MCQAIRLSMVQNARLTICTQEILGERSLESEHTEPFIGKRFFIIIYMGLRAFMPLPAVNTTTRLHTCNNPSCDRVQENESKGLLNVWGNPTLYNTIPCNGR